MFGFPALEAVILNKAMSLIVVATALLFRVGTVPLSAIAAHWGIILNLLAGSLLGAGWATLIKSETLYKVIAALLVLIAAALLVEHDAAWAVYPLITGSAQIGAGVLAGFVIGVAAASRGIAGGELFIPTLLLFGADIKLAESLSLAVSLPTMLVGFARYSRDQSFTVLSRNRMFAVVMAGGSIIGSFVGGQMLGLVPSVILLPLLAFILVVSAIKSGGTLCELRYREQHRRFRQNFAMSSK